MTSSRLEFAAKDKTETGAVELLEARLANFFGDPAEFSGGEGDSGG
jgi:hypothetical protein